MISKQDMVAARTPADLERRYNLRKSFGEAMNLATDARKAAEEADRLAQEAKKAMEGLDQEEIFRILTNNGEAKGVFRGEDGQIYINASYLATGIISSANGTVQIDLLNNKVTFSITSSYGAARLIEFISSGMYGYGEDANGDMIPTMAIMPALLTDDSLKKTSIQAFGADLVLDTGNVGIYEAGYVQLGQYSGSKVKVMGKTVSWKDNGDGTYTLIGTD